MITSLQGKLIRVREESMVIQVGGVGLEVFVPSSVLNRLSADVGHQVDVLTHLVVREDSLTLYGFVQEEERRLFELLMTVSGVGPKTALAALSTLTPEMLANAIHQDEPEVISRVPGFGKKTAQKLILELKDKVTPADLPEGVAMVSEIDTEVIEALTSLGYSIVEAQAALQAVPPDAPEDVEHRLMLALSYFSE